MTKVFFLVSFTLIVCTTDATAEKRVSFACKAASDTSRETVLVSGGYIIPDEGGSFNRPNDKEYRPSGGFEINANDAENKRINFLRNGNIEPKDYGIKLNTFGGKFGFIATDGQGSKILISHTEGSESGDVISIDLVETSQLKAYHYRYTNAKCRFK